MIPEKINFKTKDGVTIAGNYFKSGRVRSPVVLLLHMMPAKKESWNEFAFILQENDYASLAIDLRGHGESIDMKGKKLDYKEFKDEEHRGSMNDVVSAKEFLEGRKEIDISRIAIAGASIGANLALWQAFSDKDVKLLMLLSPGLNYRGIKADELAKKITCPVYIIASEDDSYAAESSRKLSSILTCEKKLEILKGNSHGTNMLTSENMNHLIVWVKERL